MANPNVDHVVSQSTNIFAGGLRVGSVQSLTPNESLTTQLIRELDADVAGEIIEIAIGVPSYTLAMQRLKLYQQTFFAALGYIVANIGEITDPVDVQSAFVSAKTGSVVAKTFVDAVPTSLGEPVAIGGILITSTANFAVRTVV